MKELELILQEIEEEILRINTEARGSIPKGTSVTGLRKAQDIINVHIKGKDNSLIEHVKKEKNFDILEYESHKGKDIKELIEYVLQNNIESMSHIAEKTLEKYFINTINPLKGEVYYTCTRGKGMLIFKRDLEKSPRYNKGGKNYDR